MKKYPTASQEKAKKKVLKILGDTKMLAHVALKVKAHMQEMADADARRRFRTWFHGPGRLIKTT